MKVSKTNEKYSVFGLEKKDGVTSFSGLGIEDLPEASRRWLANYGLFVAMTRTWAGHEKDTAGEKQDLLTREWEWLMDGCPKE